jgi:hypothetical protein
MKAFSELIFYAMFLILLIVAYPFVFTKKDDDEL